MGRAWVEGFDHCSNGGEVGDLSVGDAVVKAGADELGRGRAAGVFGCEIDRRRASACWAVFWKQARRQGKRFEGRGRLGPNAVDSLRLGGGPVGAGGVGFSVGGGGAGRLRLGAAMIQRPLLADPGNGPCHIV